MSTVSEKNFKLFKMKTSWQQSTGKTQLREERQGKKAEEKKKLFSDVFKELVNFLRRKVFLSYY